MTTVWSSLVRLPAAVARFGHRGCMIYALVDPREPSVWRYIGRSFHPERRRSEHIHQSRGVQHGAAGKELWIRNLSLIGLLPSMVVLERDIQLRHANTREQFWIHLALREGHPLTNAIRYCHPRLLHVSRLAPTSFRPRLH
ncbi:hypothetical protein ABIA18_000915 [Sinorhizobium fredii]